MVTKTLDITTLQAVKDTLLSLLDKDTEIILTENGQPVARVLPVKKLPRKQLAGLFPNAMVMHDDFDEPLPDSFWLGDE
ncbi:MAG: toxin-antitoxin (TA) system antitoxin [Anaerolineaceae bacterium]|nr:toxin-antitoxin (TA) system antitoxin [Anaerolineaceae bacterium]